MKASDVLRRKPVVLLVSALVLGGGALVSKRLLRAQAPMVGAVTTPLNLPVLANVRGASLISLPNVEKRIVVLDAFETTCGPCKKSLPKAQYRLDAHSDVHFVAVCLDEDRTACEGVASTWGLSKEVAWDEKGEARKQFKVVGIPATIVIAPNGVVTGNFGYEPSDAELERALVAARDLL